MSGGSYDYVYFKVEIGELLEGDAMENLGRAVADLKEHAPAAAATQSAQALLDQAKATRAKIDELTEALRTQGLPLVGVLHDLEWWQSGDYGRDQFEKALADYEAKTSEKP